MRRFVFFTALLLFFLCGHYCNNERRADMKLEDKHKSITMLVQAMYDEDVNKADEIFHPQCIHHVNGVTDKIVGPEAIKQSIAEMKKMFSEIKTTIDDIAAEQDKVAFRWTWKGKNMLSGKESVLHGNTFFRFRDRKVIEEWAIDDRLREMQAQGFTLTPPQASEKK
jgi:predicted ester cyclase